MWDKCERSEHLIPEERKMIKALIAFIIIFGILCIVNEVDEYNKENKIDLKEDREIRAYKRRKEWERRH